MKLLALEKNQVFLLFLLPNKKVLMLHLSVFSLKPLPGSDGDASKPQIPPGEPACSLVTTRMTRRGRIPLLFLTSRLQGGLTSLQSPGPPGHHRGRLRDGGTPAEPEMGDTLPSHPPVGTQFGGERRRSLDTYG